MRVFFAAALFFFGHLIFANSDPVIWSGIGYFVDSGKTSSIYPNLTSLEKELNLSKLLADEFSKNENLIIGGSENTSSDEGFNSVLIAVTSEKIRSTYRGINSLDGKNICERSYLLGTQVVLYSVSSKKILKSLPNTTKKIYRDDSKKSLCNNASLDSKIHKSRFAEILWGFDLPKNSSSKNLGDVLTALNLSEKGMLANQIDNIKKIKNVYEKGIQPIGVRNVVILEPAMKQLTGKSSGFNIHKDFVSKGEIKKEYKEWLGTMFSRWLSQFLKIPVVPYYEGEGLTLNLGTTFTDSAEVLNLKKPELSYGFDYVLRSFAKVDAGENATQKGSVWAVYSGMKFGVVLGDQPEDFKSLAKIPITQVTSRQYNKSDIIYDWDFYDLATQVGMAKLSENLVKQDKKWLKSSSEIPNKDFKKFSKTILNKVGYEK